jgi:hypothetical protein
MRPQLLRHSSFTRRGPKLPMDSTRPNRRADSAATSHTLLRRVTLKARATAAHRAHAQSLQRHVIKGVRIAISHSRMIVSRPSLKKEVRLSRVLTDRGTGYCGNPGGGRHSRTKTKSPQANGICLEVVRPMSSNLKLEAVFVSSSLAHGGQ